jgi:hypothetical protein
MMLPGSKPLTIAAQAIFSPLLAGSSPAKPGSVPHLHEKNKPGFASRACLGN